MSLNKLTFAFLLIILGTNFVCASAILAQDDIYTLPSNYAYGSDYTIGNSMSVLVNDVEVYNWSNLDEDGVAIFAPKDDDGDSVWAVLVSTTKKGILNFTSNGSFSYVTNGGFPGVDSFTYYVTDGNSNSSVATAYLGLRNNAPSIVKDLYLIPAIYVPGSDYTIGNSMSVLVNDVEVYNWSNLDEDGVAIFAPKDDDGDSVWAVLVSTTKKGILNFTSNGSFVYNASEGFHGVDSFTYYSSDGHSPSSSVYAYLSFNNSAPIANEDKYNITKSINTSNATGVLANDVDIDFDELELSIIEDVKFGELKTSNTGFSVNGSFNYTSNKTNGVDYFVYEVTDYHLSDSAKCIFVIGNNTAPVANADVYNYDLSTKNLSVNSSLGVLANDNDAEKDILFAELVNDSTLNGTLHFNQDGSFVYYPKMGFAGVESFTYKVTDLDLNSSIVSVRIYVNYSGIENLTENMGNETVSGEKITINFTSEVYPLTFLFKLFNTSNIVVSQSENNTANESNDLPGVYTFPSGLSTGQYSLYLYVYDASGDLVNETLIGFTNYTAPIEPSRISGGGGGSSRRVVTNQTNTTANTTIPTTSNTTVNNQTNSTVSEVEETQPSVFSTITGNVIGTTAGRWSLGVIVFLILVGFAYWIIARKRKAANASVKIVKMSAMKKKK